MILVSAIYSNGVGSIIGGRGRNLDFYLPSLINISKLGHPLVLYTEPENAAKTHNVLSPHFDKLKIIPYELSSFIYFNQFIEWKTNNVDFNTYLNDRNEVLCFSKPYWVKQAIDNRYFEENDSLYFWIDSGLTHHGIFPEKVGGVELLVKYSDEYYYPNNQNNIFGNKLGLALESYVGSLNQLFFCSLPWQGDSTKILTMLMNNGKINNIEKYITEHLIGGLFGGKKEYFLEFFDIYSSYLKLFIDNNVHTYEEQIFSAINYIYPTLLHRESFETWWFHSEGEPNSFLSQEANSFYKIFTRILSL